MLLSDGRSDGAISDDGQIMGTYLHGLFDEPAAQDALLAWAGLETSAAPAIADIQEAQLERLADSIEASLDLARLFPGLDQSSDRSAAP